MIRHLFQDFLAALQFLTILPVGAGTRFNPRGVLPFFPVVGVVVGSLLLLLDWTALQLWPRPVAALLDVAFLAFLTGALHLDGLGDAADGLYGRRTREKALAIMKDSRIGVMGLVAVVGGLAIKWGGISALESHRGLLLVVIPAFARGGMLLGMRFLPYGRPEGGTGRAFFDAPLTLPSFAGFLLPLALTVFLGWRGLFLLAAFAAVVAATLAYYRAKLGCITGDMLGAMTEVTEAALFLLMSAGGAL
jgi:adenosylcobinamide-GDP ribazoletransferase